MVIDEHRTSPVWKLPARHRAMATLQLAEVRDFDSVVNTDKLTFKAGVAYYPQCGTSSGRTTFPLLIMVGRLDQWTPASPCEDLMRRRAADSAAIDLIIYPDAHHGFVVRDWGTGEVSFGFLLEYNEGAALDSLKRAREFLHAHLGQLRCTRGPWLELSSRATRGRRQVSPAPEPVTSKSNRGIIHRKKVLRLLQFK